ncbi:hypothetical protein GGI21_002565 [Coemansia aciculifera]|nr:hypothetical protein GGI21_002565 [Coemansia aciculifera]
MSPVTRRQSMRLAEQADKEAEPEAPPAKQTQQQPPSKRDSIAGSVRGGRVTKPEPKGRVVASRYMSAANPRKPEPASARARAGSVVSAAGMGAAAVDRNKAKAASSTPRPQATSRPVAAAVVPSNLVDRRASRRDTRRGTAAIAQSGAPLDSRVLNDASSGSSATYLQWQLIEARSRIEFEENKAAVTEELSRLAREAEKAKRALLDEQRKLKLMREYSALTTWLAANKETLTDMGAQISRVSEPYLKFSEQLAQTTQAMPISGVYFRNAESLVSDMQGFVDAVEKNFSKDAPEVQDMFKMTSRLNQYYKGLAQEQDLISECDRLKQSLEHTVVLAISSRLGSDGDAAEV